MMSERGRKALAELRAVIEGFLALPVVPLDEIRKLRKVEQEIIRREGRDG